MKKTTLLFFTIVFSAHLMAQNIDGAWSGTLDIQGIKLHLVLNVNTSVDKNLSATLDSPDQGAKGIPISFVSYANSVLKFAVSSAKIEYEGTLGSDSIFMGTFKQNGNTLPLNLNRSTQEVKKIVHSQEPVKPYPYYSEDVTFENSDAKINLAGTLTLPNKDGKFPVVILIAGSGPNNRDENILGHKPFLVLSDFVTKSNMAVMRYDKRGIGQSKGKYSTATTADFASDVKAAINYLKTRKEIDAQKIGLIGHSEGGIIAPMVAANNKDVAFIILLAGTGISGDELLVLQSEMIQRASKVDESTIKKVVDFNKGAYAIVRKENNAAVLNEKLNAYFVEKLKADSTLKPQGMSDADFIKPNVASLSSPWMKYFLNYNPEIILKDVQCPVLALNGSKDTQVPASVNLEAIKKGLERGKNKNVTIKELPNLNHLFQECKTGAPSEYSEIDQTFSPVALTEILKFIQTQIK